MHHDIRMNSATEGDAVQVLAILRRDPATDAVHQILREEGLAVTLRDAAGRKDVWEGATGADAVLVDEALEPAEVAEALNRGWIPGTVPLFVLARRLPDRDRYTAWLKSGAWDIMKIPLESMALALRLENILGRSPIRRARARSEGRYAFDSLNMATDEALALARRYDRPLHCVGLAVEWADTEGRDRLPLMERLADATQRLTRRSDLLGLHGDCTLLILLPDTDASGAATFVGRLRDTLESRLQEWDLAATLRTEVAAAAGVESGGELLDATVARLRPTEH